MKGGRGNDNRSERPEGRGDIHHEILEDPCHGISERNLKPRKTKESLRIRLCYSIPKMNKHSININLIAAITMSQLKEEIRNRESNPNEKGNKKTEKGTDQG